MKNIIVTFLLTLLIISQSLFSQTYPSIINLDNVNTEIYSQPTNTPNYLESFENEQGHTITRISDVDVFNTNSQRLGHNYSKDQVWNSDETLIKLAGYPAAILDGDTYEFLYWSDIPGKARWANTEPDFMYGTLENRFVKFDVTTNTSTTLITFSEFSDVDFGYGESNQDNNDRYVGLIGDNSYFIVYDIWNNTYTTLEIPNGNLDWFSVSPLGTYAIAQWGSFGDGENEGLKRYDINLTNIFHLTDIVTHADMGLLLDNTEVYVQIIGYSPWDNDYYMNMVDLATGTETRLFEWSSSVHGNSGIWGAHVSMRTNRKGVAYVSENCCYTHGTLPNELFAIHLDGSNNIERYGKHHSNRSANLNGYHSSRIVPSRDGTRLLFVSNWFIEEWENLNSGYAFILEVPQQTLSIPEYNINEIPLIIEYYTILGQLLKNKTKHKLTPGIYIEIKTYLNRKESKLILIK